MIDEKTPVHPPDERRALLFGLLAVLLWSTVATGFKLGLRVLSVEQLLFLGTLFSWGVFCIYSATTGAWRVAREDRLLIVGLGIINPFAYYLMLFAAYDRLPAHIAQPLNYTWAITLALLAVPLLKQPLGNRTLAGILISYGGVVILLASAEQTETSGWDAVGVALALASTVLWALYWLLNTRSRSAPAALMFWSFSVGLPLVTAVCWMGPGLPELNRHTLGYGAWVGLIEMGVTFLLWQQALRRTTNTARIAQLIFLSPLASLLMIKAVLGEDISWGAILAVVVILLGVAIARPANMLGRAATG